MPDLRSDTVTLPTLAMKEAMMCAELGDDMSGEDPTVNRLEAMVAELLGKEAAVFACSGTQSNQMALRVHCQPGDELLINSTGHIAIFEGGAAAALSGITVRPVTAPRGMLDVSDLADLPHPDDQHLCPTRLVCLENTTNIGGGYVYPLSQLQRVSEWAWSRGIRMHLDGARLFNAVLAGGYTPRQIGQCFDTISICFSKGLGCPMGSILAGSHEEIRKARRVRKLFGGALRQAGIVAAAAEYALENHVTRLQDDHDNARTLAAQLSDIDGILLDADDVQSNLFYFDLDPNLGTAAQLVSALAERDVRVFLFGRQRIRVVTHLDFCSSEIPQVIDAVREALATGLHQQVVTSGGTY